MEEAEARRQRLKALREARDLVGNDTEKPAETEQPVLKFRNYAPRDQRLEHEKVAAAQPPKFEEPKPEPEVANQEDVVINVAPKKANWDLKRDIQKKLDKLERRTQRALIEIMQEEQRKRLDEEGVADADDRND